MLTEKKCKGTGKAKGHGCGELVPQVNYGQANRVYGLGKSCGCYQKWLWNTREGKLKISQTLSQTSRKLKRGSKKGIT